MQQYRVNGERLWGTIIETAQFGGTPAGGVSRITLSDKDRQVRDWFVSQCTALGCTITIDEVGNIFARRAGKDNSRPPIAFGSHLDTQPAGGKFDGIAGVLAGLELLRTLEDNHFVTNAPLELIDWTNEEGSRFAPTMIASGAFAGIFTTEFAHASKDRQGLTFGEELERIGYLGKAKAGDHTLGAYFELHIEQGPILDAEHTTIGVVTGAQGQMWYDVTITGMQGHAGTTPMPLRRNPMLACARIIDGVNQIALNHPPSGLSTVGLVQVSPNSRNVIPGSVYFTIDMRHPDGVQLKAMHRELVTLLDHVTEETNTEVDFQHVLDMPPRQFDARCVEIVREAATGLGYSHRDIVSGPGHDALNVSWVAPAAMIFIPCEKGISHNEAESATPEDFEAGANVLLQSVLAYDAHL
ncbi:MAG: Zn-dependent hydrolase [Dehalococcoidia bacterium]|nr:Zn-dependent hydrolase [Dehalococcoidia bacterium]